MAIKPAQSAWIDKPNETTPLNAERLNYERTRTQEVVEQIQPGGKSAGPLEVKPGALLIRSGASAEGLRVEGESATEHAMTAIQQKEGTGAALNVVGSNKEFSAAEISGKETGHGTLKIAHVNPEAGGTFDQNAAALSIDLQGFKGEAGKATAAQGIFMTSSTTEENFTGSWFSVRNTAKSIISRMKSNGVWETKELGSSPTGIEPTCWALFVKEKKLFLKLASSAETEITTSEPSVTPLWGPPDSGFIAWTHDPVIMRTAEFLPERDVLFCGLHLPASTITNVIMSVELPFAEPAKMEWGNRVETKVSLYNSTGTRLRESAAINWSTVTEANEKEFEKRAIEPGHLGWSINRVVPLTSPITVTAGTYYVGIFCGKKEAGQTLLPITQAEWHLQSVPQFRETREVQTGPPASVTIGNLYYSYHWPWVAVS